MSDRIFGIFIFLPLVSCLHIMCVVASFYTPFLLFKIGYMILCLPTGFMLYYIVIYRAIIKNNI